MEGRRWGRTGAGSWRGQTHTGTLLPFHSHNHNHNHNRRGGGRGRGGAAARRHSISCWYCDYKMTAFNVPLFRFGQRHASSLRLWFSVGAGFTLTSFLLVTVILIWQIGSALHVFRGNADLSDLSGFLLFGFSPGLYGLRLSLVDATYLLLSTLISVSFHEFGHAIAAASSEGIQVEYVAIFIAVLFPGALVAFEYECLQPLQYFTALRVYCAGIWHNAVCCAVCGLALFFLPLVLHPFYLHGESLMVLDIPSTSPLSGYLSPGDLIVSLDGKYIHNEQEWMEAATIIDEQTHQKLNHSDHSQGSVVHSRKGYCITTSLMAESEKLQFVDNQYTCPNDLTEFVMINCFDSNKLDYLRTEGNQPSRLQCRRCLNARDVVKLNKCGDGWRAGIINGSSLLCSQGEYCFSPVQLPGFAWAEITYVSSYSPGCLQLRRNAQSNTGMKDFAEHGCGGTFVFVGDLISMAQSVQLTAYLPHWEFPFSADLPSIMEKVLTCTFYVSLTLALLNSLPVYFLDGESILETALCCFSPLGPRKRAQVLQVCLLGGTLASILAFIRLFFITPLNQKLGNPDFTENRML